MTGNLPSGGRLIEAPGAMSAAAAADESLHRAACCRIRRDRSG